MGSMTRPSREVRRQRGSTPINRGQVTHREHPLHYLRRPGVARSGEGGNQVIEATAMVGLDDHPVQRERRRISQRAHVRREVSPNGGRKSGLRLGRTDRIVVTRNDHDIQTSR